MPKLQQQLLVLLCHSQEVALKLIARAVVCGCECSVCWDGELGAAGGLEGMVCGYTWYENPTVLLLAMHVQFSKAALPQQ